MDKDGSIYTRGSCQCGYITYEVTIEPMAAWVCWCSECQKVSAGAQTTTAGIPREAFRLTSGILKQWQRLSDTGIKNLASFCPECGNRIYHENPDAPEFLRLKTGTFADQSIVTPDAHMWVSRKPAWAVIPDDVIVYQTQEPARDMLAAIAAKRANNTES